LGVVDEGATRLDGGEVDDDAAPIRSDCARGCLKAVSKGKEETGTYYIGVFYRTSPRRHLDRSALP